ncbi:hypothetical protein HHL23_09435 [Chryseobacterium sp. RP-3-3]|uniref:Uncharacterized protein n=1 Tax=Chryseobacterium antibioticum TaxID=2728847 RepID=A0A7Y0AMM1_9FLAO|nr:hypothetical protein [Chryseobacterium antibioticum]NML70022.1 hypothetical protein [Chryseobacterium antibioticum]
MANPNTNQIGKIQSLIAKNPVAFIAAVFFLMFWITYFINLDSSKESKEDYKTLYNEERRKNDNLNYQLLIKAGIIERNNEEMKLADSTLRNQTQEQAKTILKQAK